MNPDPSEMSLWTPEMNPDPDALQPESGKKVNPYFSANNEKILR